MHSNTIIFFDYILYIKLLIEKKILNNINNFKTKRKNKTDKL